MTSAVYCITGSLCYNTILNDICSLLYYWLIVLHHHSKWHLHLTVLLAHCVTTPFKMTSAIYCINGSLCYNNILNDICILLYYWLIVLQHHSKWHLQFPVLLAHCVTTTLYMTSAVYCITGSLYYNTILNDICSLLYYWLIVLQHHSKWHLQFTVLLAHCVTPPF